MLPFVYNRISEITELVVQQSMCTYTKSEVTNLMLIGDIDDKLNQSNLFNKRDTSLTNEEKMNFNTRLIDYFKVEQSINEDTKPVT